MKRLNLFVGAAALVAVIFTASPAVMAQENGNRDHKGKIVRGPYETNRFGDNWFLGVAGGLNMFWNEGLSWNNMNLAPSIDANLGKWFTPAIGMRVGYQGFQSRVIFDDKTKNETFGYMYVHGDFLWNASDAIGGYKQTRFWNLVPYVHTGYFRAYDLKGVNAANNELAIGAGLLHNLRLVERLDLIIDMRATVVNARVRNAAGVAILPSVTMGFAVDLGWPAFLRSSTVIDELESITTDQISALESAALAMDVANKALKEENNLLMTSNKKLSRQVQQLQDIELNASSAEEIFMEMGPAVVYFDIGKAVLNEKELAHLDFIATNIISKADQDTIITITLAGTADGTTGSAKRNQYLSKARGEYIYDLLTEKYGVDCRRLELRSEVIDKPMIPELNRSVIISFR